MKLFFSFLATILAIQSFAQTELPLNSAGKIEYTETVRVDSLNGQQLYSRAKQFFANTFVSTRNVTQLSDDDGKTIVIKYVIPITVVSMGFKQPAIVHVTLNLQTKDGRYRYSFSDFTWEYKPGTMSPTYTADLEEEKPKGASKKQWQEVKDQTDISVKQFIDRMKKQLATSNDW
jgi:hypothetical protein